MPDIQTSILKTLAFFDLFDHPLTKDELFRLLWQAPNISYEQFLAAVKNGSQWQETRGFVYLQGREEIVNRRAAHTREYERKMKVARRAIRKLRYIPFLQAVFVCNTVGMGFPERESDIDVVVVSREGRLWIVRFFSLLFLRLLGLRTGKRGTANKVCLSFFVSREALNLEEYALKPEDPYLVYWLQCLLPLFDPENLHEAMMMENAWAKRYAQHGNLPNRFITRARIEPNAISRALRWFFERAWRGAYGGIIEREAKKVQMTQLRHRHVEHRPTEIVITDSVVKMHENDRRTEYRRRWEGLCREGVRDMKR